MHDKLSVYLTLFSRTTKRPNQNYIIIDIKCFTFRWLTRMHNDRKKGGKPVFVNIINYMYNIINSIIR